LLSETYLAQRASSNQTIERISERLLSPENFDPASQTIMLRTQHAVRGAQRAGVLLIEIYRNARAKARR